MASGIFRNIPYVGYGSWQAPVATAADLPLFGSDVGDVRVTQDTLDIYEWNGIAWVLVASPSAGGGIVSLNGLTVSTQFFATGTSGTDFNIVSVGSTHTFNIPSASAINRGLLLPADWTIFNNKLTSTLPNTKIFVGNGSNIATAVSLSGDASLSNIGALTLNTVNGNVGSFGSSTSIPSFTVNAKGLITAASGNVVIAPAGTLSGITLASNVINSSLTSLGTITSGVWNGSPITVPFGGTGLSSLTLNSVILGNGTSSPTFVYPGTNGNILTDNGTTWISSSPSSVGLVTSVTATAPIVSSGGSTPNISVNSGNLTDVGTDGIVITGGTNAVLGSGTSIAQHIADTTHNGYLSSTDWNTFNNKQPAGNYITGLSGDVVATGPGNVPATIQNNVVTNSKLAQMPANTIKGNNTGSIANATDLTVLQVNNMLGDILANGTVAMTASLNLGSNQIINVLDPTTAQMAATKNYVDTSLAALNPAESVYAATTANISGTYLNGIGGIGATFTTTATGTFTVDGVTPPLNSRILIKNQTSGFQNGIYNITTLGSIGVSAIFTRALNYNTASDMNSAGLIPVINGTVNALSSWQQIATITTVGTDALVFQEFTANPSLYLLKTNNLSDVSSASASFNNISPMTTTGDMIYESAPSTAARLPIGSTGNILTVVGGIPTWATPAFTGTVTSVSVVTANGISGSVATPTTTPAITLTLGAITPSSVAATGTVTGSNLSGTNTGDVTIGTSNGLSIAGQVLSLQAADSTHTGALTSTDWNTFNNKQPAGNYITALTGDATASGPGSVPITLATVNSNVGSFGTASNVSTFTVNGKGLITAASNTPILITESQVTNLVSDLAGKQPTGNYITALTGDVTATGPGSVAATLATVNGSPGTFTYATLTVNGKGLVTSASSGTSPVTSVALSDGSTTPIYTITGSPVTSTGTLTFSLSTQVKNTVFAGPSSGANAQPTFRTLVQADLPGTVVVNKSANYTILSTDRYTIFDCDTASAAFTLTLPTPVSGFLIYIKDSTGNFATNNLTLARASTEKIEGIAASKIFQSSWGFWHIYSDGTDWFIG